MREIARLARTSGADWQLSKALALLPEGGGAKLRRTIEDYEASLRPLRAHEPGLNGSVTLSVADAFSPIGAKMRPDMSEEQAGVWASALLKAWADLPAFVLRSALEEAVRVPWQFPTEMEAGVRKIAERKLDEHRTAILRLRQMLDEIHRAANPAAPQLEAPAAQEEPMSREEIRLLQKSKAWPDLKRLGLACGSIRIEDLEAIAAEEPQA